MEMQFDRPEVAGRSSAGRWVRHVCSRRLLAKRLPGVAFLRGYDASCLLHDAIAGLTVALTVIPQCMAIAVVAGLPPQYGLYSAFMNSFVYAVLGSTKAVSIGPTVITAMLTRPFVDKFGPDVAVTICFLSGCVVSLLGILNLGFLVDFISSPVLAGFMSAAALSVMSGQVPALLGLPGGGATFLEYWLHIAENARLARLGDSLLGATCIAVLALLQYINKYSEVQANLKVSRKERIYRGVIKYISLGRNAIVVMVSTAIVANLVTSDGEPLVGISGDIPEGLPEFKPPPFEVTFQNRTLSFSEAAAELSPSLIMSLTIVMEAIVSAKAFEFGKDVDATQELIAVGVSNILGSFVKSFAVTSSITRTAINFSSGVRTPIGGVFTGSLVLVSLVLLTSTLKYLPRATLAAVVMCAIVFVVTIHRDTVQLWRSNKWDLLPLYATFLGCLILGPDLGMVLGLAINILLLLYQAARPQLKCQPLKVGGRSVLLVTPDRSVTYPAAEHVKSAICKAAVRAGDGLLVVVNGHHVNHVDSTAVKIFKSLIGEMTLNGHEILFWNCTKDVVTTFIGYDKTTERYFHSGERLEDIVNI